MGLSALLALVVPASIARTSLVGAYVVIALLAVAAVAGVQAYVRRPRPSGAPSRGSAFSGIAGLALVYGVAVTLIHLTR